MRAVNKTSLAEAHTWRNTNEALSYYVQIDVMELCLPGRVGRLGREARGAEGALNAVLSETVIPD